MVISMGNRVRLVLQNGTEFSASRFGADGEAVGELVFTTSMTGHLETVTDPGYYGQIVVQTFPAIGNSGVIREDFEGEHPVLSAYIVREWCQNPSNFRNEGVIDAFLKSEGIVGICDLDTRSLTRILRENGTMNACITSSGEDTSVIAARLNSHCITGGVDATKPTAVVNAPDGDGPLVAVMDFGSRRSLYRQLEQAGYRTAVVPFGTSAAGMLAMKPDGIVLSDGPGNPADLDTSVVSELFKSSVPMLGIGLGHLVMAIAKGGKIEKLHYGHHGSSQPVRDMPSGKILITSQNHSYATDAKQLPSGAVLRYVNVNDQTVEGLDYSDTSAFSVQFVPDTSVFDRFTASMKKGGC